MSQNLTWFVTWDYKLSDRPCFQYEHKTGQEAYSWLIAMVSLKHTFNETDKCAPNCDIIDD